MYFDPLYFVMLAPAMLLALWAQFKVKSTFARASELAPSSRMSGAEVADKICQVYGIHNVKIEETDGFLGDHYDPRHKTLRLSPDVYRGRSLAALGVAAHEVGHALQDAKGYGPLKLRNGIVPLASVGSNMSFVLMMLGFFMQSFNLILLGIAAFSLVVIFQLVNLPVEFNASSRAREILVSHGFITRAEEKEVARVLNAAAMTYVAATISALVTLLYYLIRFGVIGGDRRE